MNGKQARIARRYAYREAVSRGLWKKGEASVYAKLWRRFIAWISPKARKRYTDAIGRWYRRTLKHWSHEIYAQAKDRDRIEFERLRRRLAKRREKKRIAASIAARGGR